MRTLLPLLIVALALPACAGYGPTDPSTRPAPVRGPIVAEAPAPAPADAAGPLTDADYLAARPLLIPVAGVVPERIRDSFSESRDGGARRHNAIDIMAPRGTPVLAADSGRVIRLSTSALGGITIYAVDPSERLVYYYAHLDAYHERLAQGMRIATGDTLGYVGNTGNAASTPPHLHFQVMLMPADGRYWAGEPVNPYPVLAAGGRHAAVTQAGGERGSP